MATRDTAIKRTTLGEFLTGLAAVLTALATLLNLFLHHGAGHG